MNREQTLIRGQVCVSQVNGDSSCRRYRRSNRNVSHSTRQYVLPLEFSGMTSSVLSIEILSEFAVKYVLFDRRVSQTSARISVTVFVFDRRRFRFLERLISSCATSPIVERPTANVIGLPRGFGTRLSVCCFVRSFFRSFARRPSLEC